MKAWCIKSPEGRLCLRWVDWWKSELLREFVADKEQGTWRTMQRHGWRCVPVDITECVPVDSPAGKRAMERRWRP